MKDFGGDALAANLLPPSFVGADAGANTLGAFQAVVGGSVGDRIEPLQLMPGQIGGYIVDATGATVANAQVSVTQLDTGVVRTATTDYSGRWIVSSMPSGRVKITAALPGFRSLVRNLNYDANNPTSYSLALQVGSAAETIEVQSNAQMLETLPLERDSKKRCPRFQLSLKQCPKSTTALSAYCLSGSTCREQELLQLCPSACAGRRNETHVHL